MLTKIFRVSLLLAALALVGPATPGQMPPPPPPPPAPPPQVKPPDLGRLDGDKYVNDSFGLSLAVPQDWLVVDGAQRGAILDETERLLTSEDKRKQQQLDASIARSTILLSLTKLPVGSTGQGFNASFLLVAERVPSAVVLDGADVIRSMEAGFKGTQFQVEFREPVRAERIGAADFATATVRTTAPHGVYMQKFYVTVKKGYALQLIYTYLDDSDVPTFEAMIRSLSVK